MNTTTIFIIIFSVVGIFLFYKLMNQKMGGTLTAESAIAKIKEGAFILDVRSQGEYSGGNYPGSVNIPVDQVAANLHRIPKNKTIIVYCAAGGRSAQARDILTRNGYLEVINAGGLNDLLSVKESSK